ncbi:MAG: glycosyltransferase family 1 protein [Bacteroidota bacterium]
MKVTFFHRKPAAYGSFSIEFIFEDVRHRLEDRVAAKVAVSKYESQGLFKRLYNTIEAAFRQRGDVNHMTGDTHYLTLLMRKRKTILTVHDCGFMHQSRSELAKRIYRLFWLELPTRRAQYITTNSEATKADLLQWTSCAPEKVQVIPVAIGAHFQPQPKAFNKAHPRLLHIGTNLNKNLERVIEAVAEIDCHLRIIGKLSNEQIALLKQHDIDYSSAYNISDAAMVEEYEQCDLLLFVSTFEGFGMPIIEANMVERAVLTSQVASMPDVARDAAHLVDPFEVEAIRAGLLKLITDDDYRDQLIAAGRLNRRRFDAQLIAERYLGIYRKVVNEKR